MSWTHLKDDHPKASKEHQCFLCGNPIATGSVHVKRTGVGDGGIDTFRMHELCEKQTEDWDLMDWECFEWGSMPDPTEPPKPDAIEEAYDETEERDEE